MKKGNYLIGALVLILFIASGCHMDHQRTRTVRVSNDHSTMKIQYSGKIIFSEDETTIEHMSPNAFVKYKKDGETFVVTRNGNGSITYTLYDGTRHLDYQDAGARDFTARVVKEIAAHYR
ncbi:MAG: hypothetical protein ABIX01_14935 [Chitinophagaceae bacterium]